jgi:hypothetical protein
LHGLVFTLDVEASSASFHPEILGITASSGLVVLALEIIIVRLSFVALNISSVDTVDLVAICAYKYVG